MHTQDRIRDMCGTIIKMMIVAAKCTMIRACGGKWETAASDRGNWRSVVKTCMKKGIRQKKGTTRRDNKPWI